MRSGTILYDKAFQFPDGGVIDKILIVLCEAGTDHLVVTTTSKQNSRNRTTGCQINDRLPNYFVPASTTWFNADTWIELLEVHELRGYIIDHKLSDGTMRIFDNVLSDRFVVDLLDCVLESNDIDGFDLDLIRTARMQF